MKAFIVFLKKDAVLAAAWILALASMLLVPPDRSYFSYIDSRTLGLLFCLMLIMAGFQKIGVFHKAGELLLKKADSTRKLEAVLILLCFFASMLITNDVALLTFVPFTLEILHMANLQKRAVPVIVMQTIGANMGSMLTPVGNPQNLYLYSQSQLPLWEFLKITLPYTILTFLLLGIFLLIRRDRKIRFEMEGQDSIEKKDLVFYGILFCLSLCVVARLLPLYSLLVVIVAVCLWDRGLFGKVDYALLLTFVGFFLFVGNIQRIPQIFQWLNELVKNQEVLVSIVSSQVISNVPAALLLSGFTSKWNLLIIGTNIGGLGTLIASMASLISYKFVAQHNHREKGHYLAYFSAANLIFLAVNVSFYLFLYR